MKTYDDVVAFNQGNIEAFIASGTAVAKGVEELTKEYVAFASTSFDAAVQAGKKISGAKSVNEAIDLQTKVAKENWENLVAESQKLTEISTAFMKDAAKPLSERYKATVESAAAAAPAATKSTKKAA